jgi:hypothetical protein
VIRDTTRRCLVAEAAGASVDGVFGDDFVAFEQRCATALGAALAAVGFELEVFALREIDLGETGEVIQATLRADLELELEQALARVRQVRLDNDAAMAETLAGLDHHVMLRYRQLESWREILRRGDGGQPLPAALTAMLVSGQLGDGSGGFGPDGSASEPGVSDTP